MDQSSKVSFSSSNESSSLNRTTRILTSKADITVTNTSQKTITGPLHLVINLSTGPVTITGASGGIGSGLYNTYYIDLTNAAGGSLLPQEAVTTTLEFARSSTVRFTYTMQLYGEVCEAVSSTAPEITVTPQQITAVEGETVIMSILFCMFQQGSLPL